MPEPGVHDAALSVCEDITSREMDSHVVMSIETVGGGAGERQSSRTPRYRGLRVQIPRTRVLRELHSQYDRLKPRLHPQTGSASLQGDSVQEHSPPPRSACRPPGMRRWTYVPMAIILLG